MILGQVDQFSSKLKDYWSIFLQKIEPNLTGRGCEDDAAIYIYIYIFGNRIQYPQEDQCRAINIARFLLV